MLVVVTAGRLDHRAASPLEAHVKDGREAAAGRGGWALGCVIACDGHRAGIRARAGGWPGGGAGVRAGIGWVGSGLGRERGSHGDATQALLGIDKGLELDVTLGVRG